MTIDNVGNVLAKTYTSLTPGTSYAYRVRAVSAEGRRSAWSNVAVATALEPYNAATGGTVTDVTNYNGTGQKWRVHRFTGNGTFTVSTAAQPFRVFVCGGGGAGGGADNARHSQGGEGAYSLTNDSKAIPVGAHSVVVGAGGAPVGWGYAGERGGTGGTSNLGSVATAQGGLGGYFPSAGEPGTGRNVTSTISGASVTYCQGGAGMGWPQPASPPANSGTGGHSGYTTAGGAPGSGYQGGGGATGVVIVAYRIG
jgi:hypothetical protein